MNTTDLNNYVLASSLATYLKLDFNQLLVPKIVLTDTFAGPPITGTNSLGSRLVLYNLQKDNPSYTNIGIGVDAGSWMWFGVDGASTGSPLSLGGWRFYQSTNIVATIKSNGDFICRNINCDGLTIGATDILTELNKKLTNDTTQSITCNVITSKSSIITDNKPYAHVSNTISNNGTGGFASVFVNSLNSSNIVQHSMGMKIGTTTGAILQTVTSTPLKFHTYSSDTSMFYNIPSLEISGSGSRDVTVFAPLLVKGVSTTFENNLSVGTLQLPTSTSITTVGGVLVGGKLTVNGGAIETTKLQVIVDPSPLNVDGIEILNSSNGVIAKFYNENKRVDFFGETKVYGDLYSSTKIDCDLFTAKEIKQRDINALLIKDRNNLTAIEIDEAGVEILQPLKVNSSTNSFANGLSCGVLQAGTTALGINCYSSGYFGGNLAVYGTSNLTGNIDILRSAPNGGEVTMGITNSGLNGYSALYLQSRLQGDLTRNETGQVYVGGQGMTVQTRTNHPLHLKSYCDEVGVEVPNSLTISNNATRDVIINTQLLIKGSDTIVDNNIFFNGDIMCTSIKPQGSGGLIIKKLDGSNALKVYANGITQCSEI